VKQITIPAEYTLWNLPSAPDLHIPILKQVYLAGGEISLQKEITNLYDALFDTNGEFPLSKEQHEARRARRGSEGILVAYNQMMYAIMKLKKSGFLKKSSRSEKGFVFLTEAGKSELISRGIISPEIIKNEVITISLDLTRQQCESLQQQLNELLS